MKKIITLLLLYTSLLSFYSCSNQDEASSTHNEYRESEEAVCFDYDIKTECADLTYEENMSAVDFTLSTNNGTCNILTCNDNVYYYADAKSCAINALEIKGRSTGCITLNVQCSATLYIFTSITSESSDVIEVKHNDTVISETKSSTDSCFTYALPEGVSTISVPGENSILIYRILYM